ncbi:MAG: Gfo/Idh/MocA family oxidoreductase [Planctomycetota bacterium]|nr:Gfo/Idh/MocA family oxidoreductase [Planctomycetota bacterium]
MNPTVKLGLAGCGGAFANDRAELAKDPAYGVSAVWDAEPAAAQAGAQAFPKAAACSSYAELLARADVDAVILTADASERAALACAALEAGKHVLCEGCGGRSPEEVDRILEAARANGKIAAFHAARLRLAGFTALARTYATPERLGRVYRVEAVLHRPARENSVPPEARAIFPDAGAYLLDQALDLLGWPKLEALTAQIVPHGATGEHACVYARLAGGIAFTLDVAASDRLRPRHALTILGDRGGLAIDHAKGGRGFSFIEEAPGMRAKLMESKPFFAFDPWGTSLRSFREAIESGKATEGTTPAQARELARWLALARASADQKREVRNLAETLAAV